MSKRENDDPCEEQDEQYQYEEMYFTIRKKALLDFVVYLEKSWRTIEKPLISIPNVLCVVLDDITNKKKKEEEKEKKTTFAEQLQRLKCFLDTTSIFTHPDVVSLIGKKIISVVCTITRSEFELVGLHHWVNVSNNHVWKSLSRTGEEKPTISLLVCEEKFADKQCQTCKCKFRHYYDLSTYEEAHWLLPLPQVCVKPFQKEKEKEQE
jgi:hypothetical protein